MEERRAMFFLSAGLLMVEPAGVATTTLGGTLAGTAAGGAGGTI